MFGTGKSRSRRAEIRKNRPDASRMDIAALRDSGAGASLLIALAFGVIASGVMLFRESVIPHRPGQWIPHDIVSRVDFYFRDQELLEQKRRERRAAEPRIYKSTGDSWAALEKDLLALPDRVAAASDDVLPQPLRSALDAGAITKLRTYAQPANREAWSTKVDAFVEDLRIQRVNRGGTQWPLLVLPAAERQRDLQLRKPINVDGQGVIDPELTFAADGPEFRKAVEKLAVDHFLLPLQYQMVDLTVAFMRPTHALDELATKEAENRAAQLLSSEEARVRYPANVTIVPKTNGKFSEKDWHLLRAENEAYLESMGGLSVRTKLGLAATVLVITAVMSAYVAVYQSRVVRNHARAIAIAGLLLTMLVLAQVAGVGNGPLYLFGVAPTILVALILTIAYDRRFAIGLSSLHGLLVTLALNEGVEFFLVLWVGVLVTCFLLDDIRTRSKLIEVGGAAAVAMMLATAATGLMSLDPWPFVFKNCLYVGAAGLANGFVVLGILPFIEKSFRITTGMTLLELADASQPLLRRLSIEAPGTYNHSLQVATLAEAAAEAIGANSLLCRVGAYYHDVGKINKADYFIENQAAGSNRHLNLSPSVSLLIIIGHVKDGIELAREYHLPGSLVQFIQQHHGTTLVEYFYHRACTQKDCDPDCAEISETQYRYPGPKPRTKETAIVMLCDAVESACRALPEPTPARVESLVHDLAMKRLLDGQFDECDLTMREIEAVERALLKTVMGIYHGRIQYPSMSATLAPPPAADPALAARIA
jgi:putative nucleotidyltransferase with HDIG domain